MYGFLMSVHLLVCVGLVGVVLLQSGKGGGLAGGAFGGSAQTVFGGRGATDFITRATMVLGAAFFVTSLALSLMSTGAGTAARSLLQEEARRAGTAPGALPPSPGGAGQSAQPGQPSQTGAPTTAPAPGGAGVGGAPAPAPPAGATSPAAPATPARATPSPPPQSGKPPGGR